MRRQDATGTWEEGIGTVNKGRRADGMAGGRTHNRPRKDLDHQRQQTERGRSHA